MPSLQKAALKVSVAALGLALDFWKDGAAGAKDNEPKAAAPKDQKAKGNDKKGATAKAGPKLWAADRPQVLEKIWGPGLVLPGGIEQDNTLTVPLGLTHEMSVLDLCAGLGAMARLLAITYNCYVTGLEPDAALAKRGMIMSLASGKAKQASVEAYDPSKFQTNRKYDCVIARELFFRVPDKKTFFATISGAMKVEGQLVATDFTLEPEAKANPAVLAWLAKEPQASPLSVAEIKGAWKSLKYDVRTCEDQTALYQVAILEGITAFRAFLKTVSPDGPTKALILSEIELWVLRLQALQGGLKFTRIYAIKY